MIFFMDFVKYLVVKASYTLDTITFPLKSLPRIAHVVPPNPCLREMSVDDEELRDLLGNTRFYSITYRLFKIDPTLLETLCEDYGQVLHRNT
jgi:transcription antitermination factor NusG